MRLYNYWRSSSAWRVRIVLELKGIAYECAAVHLLRDGGEQNVAAYRALNPLRQVPLLEIERADGRTLRIAQSLAIITYLDVLHPEPAIFPADPETRALALQMVEIVNSGIQPLQNTSVLEHLTGLVPGVDRSAWVRYFQARGLEALERLAAEVSGRFMIGDEPGAADAYLVPQLYQCRRHRLDLAPYPTLVRIDAACSALPAFARAHADRQPDAGT